MFKKNKPKHRKITKVVDLKNRVREFFLDTQISNAHEAALNHGCSPISDELAEREEFESDLRVERIQELLPLLYNYSTLYSSAIEDINFTLEGNDSVQVPAAARHALAQVSAATRKTVEHNLAHILVGTVSQLVDLGFLELPKKKK